MKLVWLTDIHLNFLELVKRNCFYQMILEKQADVILISGDIAQAPSVCKILTEMQEALRCRIYFVLGNHDYYHGKISEVQNHIVKLTLKNPNLCWLSDVGVVQLSKNTVLVGQDGWADGRLGDYHNSQIKFTSARLIVDLFQQQCLNRDHLLAKMQSLADSNAKQLQHDLHLAGKNNAKHIIVATHIPPFKENCFHHSKISNDAHLPYVSSKAMGDVLLDFAQSNSKINIMTLCGHTHNASHFRASDNLEIKSGHVEYFQPEIQEIIYV